MRYYIGAIRCTPYLEHHGILGMKWGKQNGPPYPLDAEDHSKAEKKANYRKSLGGGRNEHLYDLNTKQSDGKSSAKKGFTDGQKKAIKIAAATTLTAIAAYGAYRMYQNGAFDNIIRKGDWQKTIEQNEDIKLNEVDAMLGELKKARDLAYGSTNEISRKASVLPAVDKMQKLVSDNSDFVQYSKRIVDQRRTNIIKHMIQNGSGINASDDYCACVQRAVLDFTGGQFSLIRKASLQNSENSSNILLKRAATSAKFMDDFLSSAPKYKGGLARGISVTEDVAKQILANDRVDMLGPASWTKDISTAKGFATLRDGPVKIIFRLADNKSGVDISGLSAIEAESEVLSPAGIKYIKKNVEETMMNGFKTYLVDIAEDR